MRIIKFRAWHRRRKRMECYFLLTSQGIPQESVSAGVGKNDLEDNTELILMQYIGLTDKNGLTEVYEGDIIDSEGMVKGNIYEMDKGKTDLVIQGFGTKTWCKTYNEAIHRGCKDSE